MSFLNTCIWRIISGVAIALGFINIFIGVKLDDM